MQKRYVYADTAATTPVAEEVLAEMLPYFREQFANPSALYAPARVCEMALVRARERAAAAIGAYPDEIFFTSGGSESDNWALRGSVQEKRHIVTTAIEHHAVLRTCEALEREGCEVTYLPVTPEGFVRPEDAAAAIREDTALVSVMYANNEIGTIQPVQQIAAVCRERGVPFHTDAVQAVGNVPIDVHAQGIDMLSLSGHKLHAPKGIGLLYIRRGLHLRSLICGGMQESGRRAGTENVPGIIGLAKALELACADIPAKIARLTPIRDRLIDGILAMPQCCLNGSREDRLCGNVNVSIEGIEGESLLLMLDAHGICASSGSACAAGFHEPSHVLRALGRGTAHNSLRLTFGEGFTDADADYILEVLPQVVGQLRGMSPLYRREQDAVQ